MTNLEVLKRFTEKRSGRTPQRDIYEGYYVYNGRTLTTDGLTLINYNTVIASWEKNTVLLNMKKYSRTTSKIQHQLKNILIDNGVNFIEMY